MVTPQSMTAREMRGMAMANTIGRRDNPEVSIKRFNKLTYKVKSQSSADTWYIVVKTYNSGWTCECPGYTYRNVECKHIHCVKFSKLLRKKIYQDTHQLQEQATISQDALKIGQ